VERIKSKLLNNGQNIGFLHDEQLLAVHLDFGSGILGKQNLVANLNIQLNGLAVFGATGANCVR